MNGTKRGADYAVSKIEEAKANVPEEKSKEYKKGMSFRDSVNKLHEFIGEGITLKSNDGEEARLSKRSIGKLVSNAAVDKSMANGFYREQHYAVASDIGNVFENSVKILEHPDKYGSIDIVAMHRFAAPLFEDNVAYITVKGKQRTRQKDIYRGTYGNRKARRYIRRTKI
jgi:hypothetical protein